MKKVIFTPNAPTPIGPYSQATEINNTLYVSGQIAINPVTNELELHSIAQETALVLSNLQAVLSAAGYAIQDVMKCSIFLSNMDYFNEMNKVYSTVFNENPPAREAVAVRTLPKNVNIEISCIAVR